MDSASAPDFCTPAGYGDCFPKDWPLSLVAQQQGVDFQLLQESQVTTPRGIFFNKVRAALWTLRASGWLPWPGIQGDTDDIRESQPLT